MIKIARVSVVIIAAFVLQSCELGLARRTSESCATSAASDIFAGALSGNEEMGAAATAEFSELLPRMLEPNLSCGTDVDEAYRLSVVAALNPERRVVRVWRHQDRHAVSVAVLDSRQPSGVPSVRSEAITASQFDGLRDVINAYQLWQERSWQVPPPGGYRKTFDNGASWVLEGKLDGWYHAVIRGRDDKDPKFDAVVRTLFELGKIPSGSAWFLDLGPIVQ